MELAERVRDPSLRDRVADPHSVVDRLVRGEVTIAFSGMTGTSVPKEIPRALAKLSEERGGLALRALLTGGSTTPSFEESLAKLVVRRRYLVAGTGPIRERINRGEVAFLDPWLAEYGRAVGSGLIPEGGLDIAVIEATCIDEGGRVIPSLSLDYIPEIVKASRHVVVEISAAKPVLEGLHDVYTPKPGVPIPIRGVLDRPGRPHLRIPRSKLAAIVISESEEEYAAAYQSPSPTDRAIARNILAFLSREAEGDGPLTIQAGSGPLASALLDELEGEVRVWTEVLPLRWITEVPGKVQAISTSCLYSLRGEEKYREEFYGRYRELMRYVVIRPYTVTNSLEVISRLGVVSVQQALEVDVYGNVNVSHIGGAIYTGVGGSGEFTRAARITIVATPSTTSNGAISRVVPLVSHVDIPEHDVDVLVTEVGWADLRGLSPRERAALIVERCAHPSFQERLRQYLRAALSRGGHEPVHLGAAAAFHGSGASQQGL